MVLSNIANNINKFEKRYNEYGIYSNMRNFDIYGTIQDELSDEVKRN